MKTNRLILIGLLFFGSIIILIWGLNFLSGKNFFQPEKEYYARYKKIGGLMISSPVTIKGFKVGDVRDIRLSDNNFNEVLVKFVITYPDLELPIATVPQIYSTDLMGTKGIQLVLTDSASYYSYGDTLSGSIEGDLKDQVNTQMLPLKRKAEDLMSSMDSVLVALHLVFDKENRSNITQSFAVVAQTLMNFEQTSVFLDTFVKSESHKFSLVMNNLDSLSNNLVVRTNELQNTLINLSLFTDSLNKIPIRQTVAQFNDVLANIDQLIRNINEGEGSLGKLVINDSLYYAIESVSLSLNDLLDDIRQNPKRYVHLSAFDRGKTIVLSDQNEVVSALAEERDLRYYACLMSSVIPLNETHSLFTQNKKVESVQIGKTFYYYLLETTKFDKARRVVQKHIRSYPEASVYTWLNGQWTRIPF